MQLEGTIRYIEIGMGFWGFEARDGSKWELFDLPEAYRKDGLNGKIEFVALDGETINMWGRPAKFKAMIE